MKPLRRNGLKGHQHLAQGIALGRKTNIIFALNQRSTAEGKVKGQKPYLFHYAFAPAGRSQLRITSIQGDALGWKPTSLSGYIAEHPKLKELRVREAQKAEKTVYELTDEIL